MKPVMQSITTAPGGDCFRACVASILDLSLDDVPHFFEHSGVNDFMTQAEWVQVRCFAREHQRYATHLDPDGDPAGPNDLPYIAMLRMTGEPYIAIGKSPAGDWGHCVVMQGTEFVHDPSPSGRFLDGEPWLYVALLPGHMMQEC